MPREPVAINARNVAILVFDGVEVLDFAGPYEVFSVAAAEMPRSPYTPFFTYTIGLTARAVETYGGLTVTPRFSLGEAPPPDAWLAEQSARVEVMASVCTGALALARAGVLKGKRATTHHGAFDRLPELDPSVTVVRDVRYVRDGNVWTSGGISAGIDMSLAIVEELLNDSAPILEEMEWMWHSR
jgi:transcriptional regulator GlxA family with amidase domain